jgi:glycosyltransferase involved in cell wall biosynthesis
MKLALLAPAGPVGTHRGGFPFHYLGSRGHLCAILGGPNCRTPEEQRIAVSSADVVHVVGCGGLYEDMPSEWHERRGALVVDCDDLLDVWHGDPAAAYATENVATMKPFRPEHVAEVESWIRAADLVTTTTETLAHKLVERGAKVVRVCPNAIPPDAFMEMPKKSKVLAKIGLASDKVIAWTGSVAHIADLPPVLEAVARIGAIDAGVTVRTLGPCDWGIQCKAFASKFRGNYQAVVSSDAAGNRSYLVPFEAYFQTLTAMAPTVAVIPMRASPLNECKSDVTALTWAALGVPSIMSDFGPYAALKAAGMPGQYVSHDAEAFTLAIREMLYAPEKAKQMGAEAREWVREHASYPKASEAWEAAFAMAVELRGAK